MKDKTCCFSGHRNIPPKLFPEIQNQLEREIYRFIEQGVCYFGAGGARGFDTLAALTVLAIRNTNPSIKLILALPCRKQADSWSYPDKACYQLILSQADKIVYLFQHYERGCYAKRNRHLVDNSSVCICYLNQKSGGTFSTVRYAENRGLTIINCADASTLL